MIDTSEVGAGTLSVTVDGPSKVDMDCVEVDKGKGHMDIVNTLLAL